MVVDMGQWGSGHGDSLDQRSHHRGDEGLLVVHLGVALVGDGMGQGLHDGHGGHMVDSRSHIGLVVHHGNGLDHRHHWSNMLHDGNNGSHMLDHRSHGVNSLDHRNHWGHSLDHGNSWHHMLHHGSEHRLVVELGEALVRSGHRGTVHHSTHFGHNGGDGHMVLLNESRGGGGNGGQGTDGNLGLSIKLDPELDP